MSDSKPAFNVDRRKFLKVGGATGAAVGGLGMGLFGYAAGKDPNSYLGWQTYEGVNQFFNRKRYEVDKPTYISSGTPRRVDPRVDQIFERRGRFMMQYMRGRQQGLSGPDMFEEPLRSYYRENPEVLELDILNVEEIQPKQRVDSRIYGQQFLLAEAWANAMGAVGPRGPQGPPAENDFPRQRRMMGSRMPGGDQPQGDMPTPPTVRNESGQVDLKDPVQTARLIKKIAHELGSTLVGITKLNPDWVYGYPIRGRGFENLDEPLEIPEHWEYAIVVGTPMSWDPMYANPTYGTSSDAYSRSRIVAARLEAFIKTLGFPARTHVPGTSYDLMVPPIAIDAGLGEQGRHSVMITPELGSNIRPAVITTNIPMAVDKPIDFGVQDFCKHCKVCAENCPSGAIPMGDKVEINGYLRYELNQEKCQNFWNSCLGSMGCRICIACCPYTRKANWLHRTALNVTANDPTNISDKVLTSLQKSFYPGPDPLEYFMPSMGGSNASYREPPWWLKAEDFIHFTPGTGVGP